MPSRLFEAVERRGCYAILRPGSSRSETRCRALLPSHDGTPAPDASPPLRTAPSAGAKYPDGDCSAHPWDSVPASAGSDFGPPFGRPTTIARLVLMGTP
eukprot:scaffold7340_cov266-Pinguiococcus_pyrenoidosus.AAC.36